MKKTTFLVAVLCLLSLIVTPLLVSGQSPLVPQTCGIGTPPAKTDVCTGRGQPTNCPCGIYDFFLMLANIYNFIVWYIATPLAVVSITIGGIFILISAGNPSLFNTGKEITKLAIIGLALVFCSWLIINFVLTAVGYKDIGNWSNLF